MSGIVGIVNFDGAPVDRALLSRMTNFMKFRGPDEQRIWVDGNVGFGHTLLRTTFESEREHQPFTLDGRVWIVADARVDAQADLIAKLTARGEEVARGATDVELLLRAYRAWGEDCVEHLLGDFAFAVWDGPNHRLFCARDHLGVKPFFYTQLRQTVIFSNTLDSIRMHPAVSEKLNDSAIADFLLFGRNQDPATTSFADVQRMPPAHRATASAQGVRISRYWTLPIDEPVYYRRAADYTDRFNELLDLAVSDRLRTNNVGINMSGGLDSTTLAAAACKILRSRSSDFEVRASTTVCDALDGGERHYASLVAKHLDIHIDFYEVSPATIIDPHWYETKIHTPEPVTYAANLGWSRDGCVSTASHTRVWFHGEGPDNALQYEWRTYLAYLLRERQFGRVVADVCRHVLHHRRVPLLRSLFRKPTSRKRQLLFRTSFPQWLDPEFASRMQLLKRWQEVEEQPKVSLHPWRPVGYDSFGPHWDALFRSMDPEETGAALEYRHPFVDLRLLRYMLSLPTIPWCRAKEIERRAMRGLLPHAVVRRPKAAAVTDITWKGMCHYGLPSLPVAGALSKYVKIDCVPKTANMGVGLFRVDFKPFALQYWLQNLQQPVFENKEDTDDELATYQAAL